MKFKPQRICIANHEDEQKFHDDPNYRASYSESYSSSYIAAQIRVLREQRGWTQEELAKRIGMKQSRISECERPDYADWNLSTLRRFARVFDITLKVSFEEFGNTIRNLWFLGWDGLQRDSFAQDQSFHGKCHCKNTRSTKKKVYR